MLPWRFRAENKANPRQRADTAAAGREGRAASQPALWSKRFQERISAAPTRQAPLRQALRPQSRARAKTAVAGGHRLAIGARPRATRARRHASRASLAAVRRV